ncbi:hypothetical protein F5I97DRAFT_1827064 [Phlebopus sp. FC_14]|nr:hypothetical protein F5I97DRAFT_1827064 [Phlebopus sp. FC_14]
MNVLVMQDRGGSTFWGVQETSIVLEEEFYRGSFTTMDSGGCKRSTQRPPLPPSQGSPATLYMTRLTSDPQELTITTGTPLPGLLPGPSQGYEDLGPGLQRALQQALVEA